MPQLVKRKQELKTNAQKIEGNSKFSASVNLFWQYSNVVINNRPSFRRIKWVYTQGKSKCTAEKVCLLGDWSCGQT